jgi:hypothetical protein
MRRPSARKPVSQEFENSQALTTKSIESTGQANAWPSTFSHSVARLTFDSEVDLAYVGCGATQTSPKRRLHFETEDSEMDLETGSHPVMQSSLLAGQITLGPVDARGGWLRLLKGRDQWLVRLDESGEFRLDGLPPGAYRLEFVFKNRTIELPVLSL